MDIKDFVKVKVEDAIKVPTKSGPYLLTSNKWWIVTEDDCILYYKGCSRQCNPDITIVEHLIKTMGYDNATAKFLESVWEPYKY